MTVLLVMSFGVFVPQHGPRMQRKCLFVPPGSIFQQDFFLEDTFLRFAVFRTPAETFRDGMLFAWKVLERKCVRGMLRTKERTPEKHLRTQP